VILAGSKQKRDELNTLLADPALERVIIFSRTKHGADRVAKNLAIDGHEAAAIHGNKSQNARQAALKALRRARRASSSPPTSRRAASTCRTSRMSSTTNCPTMPRTTSTASAAPAATARRAPPSR
jgi:hypothetical protein